MSRNLYLDIQELRKRESVLRKLMKPLYAHHTGPPSISIPKKNEFFVGLSDTTYQTKMDHREWRFRVLKENFYVLYFERWVEGREENNRWYIDRAYLNLYKINLETHKSEEYIALHCDPLESEKSPHYFYKRGPHLHISCAEHPIPKAHLGLNMGHLDSVLNSTENLTNAIANGIKLIRDQIIDLAV